MVVVTTPAQKRNLLRQDSNEALILGGSTLRGTTHRVDTQIPPHAHLLRLSKHGWVRGGEQTLQQACSQEYPRSARCVQSFDDSLDSAIRITYRISLRSSSMWEPRHPSLKVVLDFRLSAAQAHFSEEINHAEYAALGFSVSRWRQIGNVWV